MRLRDEKGAGNFKIRGLYGMVENGVEEKVNRGGKYLAHHIHGICMRLENRPEEDVRKSM